MCLFFRLFSVLIALITIAAGLLFWRLTRGPIPLDFLTPRLLAAAREAQPDLQVTIGATQLLWDTEGGDIDLSASDVHVGNGRQTVTIPRVAVTLDALALLQGRVALSAIELVGPSLRLVREADGSFGVGSEGGGGGLLGGQLIAPPGQSRVRNIGVRDADVEFDDRITGQVWKVANLDLDIEPTADTVPIELKADVGLGPVLGDAAGNAHLGCKAVLWKAANTIEASEITVDVGDASLRGSAGISGLRSPSLAISAQVALERFAVDALPRYWPADAAVTARQWVTTNITGGQVQNVKAQIAARQDGGEWSVGSLGSTFEFDALSVRFLDTMPPASGVGGSGTASLAGGDFTVTRGRVLDVAITQATVKLPADGGPRIVIDAGVAGPVTTTVSILDSPPIELTKTIGFSPQAGTMTGSLGLAFPLRDGLRLPDLGLTAEAKANGVVVDKLVQGVSVRDGNLTFSMKSTQIAVDADGKADGLPLRLAFRETIGLPSARRIELKGDVAGDQWKKVGVDLSAWVQGPTAVTAQITTGQPVIVDANADLTRARLEFPGACLKKASGVPGRASARFRLAGGALTAIERFEASFGGTSVHASAVRAHQLGWRSLKVDGTFAPPPSGGNAGRAVLDVAPAGDFTFKSPDAGALLASFAGPYGQGGPLNFAGVIQLNRPGVPFEGSGSVTGFRVVHSPLLTKVLQLASLRGLLSMMTSEGLLFEKIKLKLGQASGAVRIEEAKARSDSMSLITNGSLDLPSQTLDLRGQVIPSYFGVNEGVGKIPILGSLLTGSDAKAVQAIDFEAKGAIADPSVKVNPLTSLTPQVLQDLWRKLQF